MPLVQREKKTTNVFQGLLDLPGALNLPFSGEKENTIVPNWLIQELEALSKIEPALYPTKEVLEQYQFWEPGIDNYAASLYKECVADFVDYNPDVIFLVPYLARGGADLGIIHHVRLCVEQGMRVTVVTTRDDISPWLNRLPESVRVLEFGRVAHIASDDDKRLVLLRLLLQSPAKRIHLINSLLGWEIVNFYGKPLVSEGKKIYVSLFCDDIDHSGLRRGYATEFLPPTWHHLAGILSDNAAFLKSLHDRDGYPTEILHTVYFPNETPQVSTYQEDGRVLWASRIASQKRPELLCEIARAMPDISFDVYGEHDRQNAQVVSELKQLNNVTLCGSYDSFPEIAQRHPYSLFLYTSKYDGLPNVLLEATAAGLPIVTANVGGIAELVDDETGYLLPTDADAFIFIEAIRNALRNPAQAEQKMKNAQMRLSDQHSLNAFKNAVIEVPGYFSDGSV